MMRNAARTLAEGNQGGKAGFDFRRLIVWGGLLVLFGPLVTCFFFLDYDVDVSDEPRFSKIHRHCFELQQDAFLWRWYDTRKPELTIPGKSHEDHLPRSVDFYREYPESWSRVPEGRKDNGDLPQYAGEVVAVIDKGTPFVVAKIIENHNVEVGTTVEAKIRLLKTVGGIEEIGANYLFETGLDEGTLKPDLAAIRPCPLRARVVDQSSGT